MSLERDRLWPRVWLIAGRTDDLRPDERRVFAVGDQEVLLWKDGAGTTRAFGNFCTHRGTRLCDGGSGPRVTCHFHGWTFASDGRLVETPGLAEIPDAPLSVVRAEERYGFTWICFDPDAPSLAEFLAPVDAELRGFGIEKAPVIHRLTVGLDCNWKVGVEVHSEPYHVPALHPGLIPVLDIGRVTAELRGPHAFLKVPALSGSWSSESVFVFPNLHINRFEEETEVLQHFPHPSDPERCQLEQMVVKPGAEPSSQAARREVAEDDPALGPVLKDDIAIVRAAQRGMRSRGFTGPRFTHYEGVVTHFNAGVDGYLGVASDPTATSRSDSTRPSA
jgi:phenylpropionate dioxygenase-like ring-hydroxylating dioxygenase large terminal subunit